MFLHLRTRPRAEVQRSLTLPGGSPPAPPSHPVGGWFYHISLLFCLVLTGSSSASCLFSPSFCFPTSDLGWEPRLEPLQALPARHAQECTCRERPPAASSRLRSVPAPHVASLLISQTRPWMSLWRRPGRFPITRTSTPPTDYSEQVLESCN